MTRLSPLIVLLLVIASFGQNEAKTILVDEFGQVSCDEFLARIDNFYHQINANPGSKGYFVIAGSKALLEKKLSYELLFESAVQQRLFDRTLTSIIRGYEHGPLEIKLWIGKSDARAPNFGEAKWDLRLPSGSAPHELRSDMAQICDPPPVDRVAKDLLEANPDGSIFVIVHGPTARQRRGEFRVARKMLAVFDPKRIRYLLRRSQAAYSDYYFAVGRPKRTDFKSWF